MNQGRLKSSERLYVRELTIADATAEYCAWLNDQEVTMFLETRSAGIDDLREYIQKRVDDPNSVFMGVFDGRNNVHIGNVKLEPIDWAARKAVLGILIGNKDYWGRGIGTEATALTVAYAFDNLGLDEVQLGVIAEHKKAIRAYEKAGFAVIGIREKAINHSGMLFDDVLMAIKKKV